MAQNPSALKRQKELARLEWQKEKKEKRRLRKQEKEQTPGSESDSASPEEAK